MPTACPRPWSECRLLLFHTAVIGRILVMASEISEAAELPPSGAPLSCVVFQQRSLKKALLSD